MALTRDEIRNIANLASIDVDDASAESLKHDLDRILGMVDQLKQADVDEIEPLAHPMDLVQRLREDKVTEQCDRDRYQENAPSAQGGVYLVPRVLGE